MNPAQLGVVALAVRQGADGPSGEHRRGSGLPLAIVLLVGGIVCFIGGSALAWGTNPLLGFSVGGLGTILLVVGSILARNAMVGHYLRGGDE